MCYERWPEKTTQRQTRSNQLWSDRHEYNLNLKDGTYSCKACGEALFDSGSKFDAGCGWPSFDEEIAAGKVKEVIDETHGMRRVEVVCANCEGHLGHVFNDGPSASGLRYCVNSVSVDFEESW